MLVIKLISYFFVITRMHTFTRSLLAVILTLHAQFVTPAQNVEAEHHCQVIQNKWKLQLRLHHS